jgi:MFS family permease
MRVPATDTRGRVRCKARFGGDLASGGTFPQIDRGMAAPASLSPARAAWVTLAILSGLNFLNYLDRYVMSAVLTPLQKDLHLDDTRGGWAASAFMLGYFLTAPFFGYLGDRYPRKYLMLGGVIAWSLATAASGLAQNFTEFFCIRIFVGIGEACFVTMGPSWISDLFASTRRNTAITLFYVAIPVGSAIGFTIGGWFAARGDWRGAFWWVGLPGVVLALSLLFLREPRRGEADGLEGKTPVPARFREVLHLLLHRRYNLLVWGYAAQTFSIGAFAFWGPSFLHRIHALPLDRASTLFGEILAGTGLVATLLGGFLANQIRRRMATGYVWLMALSMTLAIPVCFFALMTTDVTLCLSGLAASMFFLFLPTGPITSEIFEIVPVHLRASAVALCTFMIHLFGDLGSPAAVGFVSDRMHHDLRAGVLVLPGVLVAGSVLWWILLRCTPVFFKVEP